MAQSGERRVTLLKSTTVSGTGTTADGNSLDVSGYTSAILVLNVTAQSGTSPTLDVYVQQELPIVSNSTWGQVPDGTSAWDDFAHFTQVAGATGTWVARVVGGSNVAAAQKDASLSAGSVANGPIGSNWRVKYVLAGTTPSFTFSVSAILIP
jgi:hypothetical protein